ncbi:MAG: ACT domain-containing protein [Anaerolineae bacterium]
MAAQRVKIGGILRYTRLALVGVMSAPDRPGLAAAIFRALGEQRLNTQFIVQSIDLNNESHVQFCVAGEDLDRVMGAVQPVAERLGARKVIQMQPVAILAVFGPDFRERPGIAGAAFDALARADINILAVSTSISTVSCVIAGEHYDRALTALHQVFEVP